MRTKVNCEELNVLTKDINSINDSLIKETNDSIGYLNSIKTIWQDYNSDKIIDEMITIVSTLNNVSTDLNTLSNFCVKATNSYTDLDTDFKEKLIRNDNNE